VRMFDCSVEKGYALEERSLHGEESREILFLWGALSMQEQKGNTQQNESVESYVLLWAWEYTKLQNVTKSPAFLEQLPPNLKGWFDGKFAKKDKDQKTIDAEKSLSQAIWEIAMEEKGPKTVKDVLNKIRSDEALHKMFTDLMPPALRISEIAQRNTERWMEMEKMEQNRRPNLKSDMTKFRTFLEGQNIEYGTKTTKGNINCLMHGGRVLIKVPHNEGQNKLVEMGFTKRWFATHKVEMDTQGNPTEKKLNVFQSLWYGLTHRLGVSGHYGLNIPLDTAGNQDKDGNPLADGTPPVCSFHTGGFIRYNSGRAGGDRPWREQFTWIPLCCWGFFGSRDIGKRQILYIAS